MRRALFLHLHKTGGTSLYRTLCDIYGEAQVYNPRVRGAGPTYYESEEARSRPIVFGHFQFAVDQLAQFNWVGTILRHPVPRIYSLYRHARADSSAPLHEAANELDFSAFIRLERSQLENDQTRRLAGWRDKHVNAVAFAQALGTVRALNFVGLMRDGGVPLEACARSIARALHPEEHRTLYLDRPQRHERAGQQLSPDVPPLSEEDERLILSRNHFDLSLCVEVILLRESRRR